MTDAAIETGDAQSDPLPPDRRLTPSMRIAHARTFREAFDAGRGKPGRFMVLWLGHGEDAHLRLGVVASKRSFRRAVDRSRAKRLLREAFRLNRYRFSGSADVILLARPAIKKARCADVEKDLLDLARRSGIMAHTPSGETHV